MHSPPAVLLRGLVMLACLVAIPMAALLGTSLPDMFRSVLDGRLAILPSLEGSTVETVPQFEPMPVSEASPPPPESTTPSAGEAPRGAAVPGVWQSPPAVPRWPEAAEPACLEVPVPAADPFLQIQQRLRQLGATYYLLESWGDRQYLYRFYCKMAIGGNPAHTRQFEATDAEPLRAMAEVLRQVETWRAGWP
jgi:hypothetical protein